MSKAFISELKKQHADFMRKQKKQAGVKRRENKKQDDELELYNPHYTDAPSYAEEYYGEVYRATTRYDNDWD